MTNRVLLTVKQFSESHPSFPVAGLRWQIFHEDTNGLREAGAILRMGRKVLIDEDRFFNWLDSRNGVGARAAA
jgi:hypothetical protein